MSQLQHPSERRVSVRWQSSQQASCHFATLAKITSRWAQVLTVSSKGICLSLPVPLDPGQEIFIELPCKDPAKPQAVTAFAVHAQPQDASWTIGCTFARDLTAEELQMLL